MSTLLSASAQQGRQALISVGDVAQWLGVSKKWVYRKVAAGSIPHVRVGSLLRFNPILIEAWLHKN